MRQAYRQSGRRRLHTPACTPAAVSTASNQQLRQASREAAHDLLHVLAFRELAAAISDTKQAVVLETDTFCAVVRLHSVLIGLISVKSKSARSWQLPSNLMIQSIRI